MFGDYGHGSLFFFVGCVMTLFHDRLKKIPAMAEAQKARYMFVMMGFFAMYNGLLYNEFFAIPNDWFGSCYDISKPEIYEPDVPGGYGSTQATYPQGPAGSDCVYVFGVDPTWFLSP
jgi:V-type H+-transporting ATPase subunit a